MKNIGLIGLGLMGTAITGRILETKDVNLYIWNRSIEKGQALIQKGAKWAVNPADLGQYAEVMLLWVKDEIAVEEVLFGKEGVFSVSQSSKIILDHSTISSSAAKAIAKKVKEAGSQYLDVPVTGGVPGAIHGTLTIFAGGSHELIQTMAPIFSIYAKRVNHMGETGAGQSTKVCNQTVLLNMIMAIFEMLNLAKQQGLDLQKLISAFDESLFDSKAWKIYGNAVINNSSQKLAPIKNVMKDLKYICEVGDLVNNPLFMTRTSYKLVEDFMKQGMGDDDIVKLMELYKSK